MAKRRPSGDGMIRKRTDGRWEGRIVVGHKDNGLPIYRYALSKTQREVTVKIHRMLDFYRGCNLSEDSKMSLSQWLERWIETYKSGNIRPSTVRSYENYIRMQINPRLGTVPISALTTTDIQKMYNDIKAHGKVKDGGPMADSSVRHCHMILHEAMEDAIRSRLVAANPTNGTVIPKKQNTSMNILNNEQLDRFMEVIKTDIYWYEFFYTEMTTGLRRGEICGLKWDDFNKDSGTLTVRRTLVRTDDGTLTEGYTKTEKGTRTILLPASTADMLCNRLKTAVSEWIFPNQIYPERPTNPATAYKRMKKLLKDAGLPDIRFHDLRHTFATHALASGVDPKTLSGILGHTDASFTLDTYTHVTTDMQRNAAEIIGGCIFNLIGDELTDGKT